MDTERFDTIVKLLATRWPRRAALPFLAVLSLAGAQEAGAKKHRGDRPRRVCKCPDANPATCRTTKVKKSKVARISNQACNYRGACQPALTDCAGSLVGPPGPPGLQGPAGPAGAGLDCPTACPTCQTCDPVRGACVVNPRENGAPGTGCEAPTVCCGGTCCTGVRQCNPDGTCATCAEVCEANCGRCQNLAQGGTRCGNGARFVCELPCNTSADCRPDFPSCLESVTDRGTNETESPSSLGCPPLPPGMRGVCSILSFCSPPL